MGKFIRINMADRSIGEEQLLPGSECQRLGGRGLSARLLLQEVLPHCDPLGEKNKLILAPGLLSGTAAPTSGRTSVGAKSPLTRGIKEANVGGQAGQKLAKLGIKAVIIEGQPHGKGWYLIKIDRQGASLHPADHLAGLTTYEVSGRLAEEADKRAAFIVIGQAGERGMAAASVALTDLDNRYPTRHAARGGLGAVMGSKRVKAIIVDDAGTYSLKPVKGDKFREMVTTITKDRQSGKKPYARGTSAVVGMANEWGNLPTRNRRSGQFEGWEKISGDRIVERFAERGGGMHNCLAGCIIRCSNTIFGPNRQYVTSALEFETIALLGSNLGIDDLDAIATMDRLCDEFGLDTIETGGAIGVAMDGGVLPFGDAQGAINLIREIGQGTTMGKILGQGVAFSGRAFNVKRIPAVKGQGIPAWEPRTLRGTGITYATSAMGADHTAGLVFGGGKGIEGLAKKSREAQIYNAVVDSSGFCQFMEPSYEEMAEFCNAMYGWELTKADLRLLGWSILQDEWKFNRLAGYTVADDRLPEFMATEPIPSNKLVFDVPDSEIQKVYALD